VQLANALGIGSGPRPAPPLLAVVGSITATTRDQVLETEQVLGARFVDVDCDAHEDTHDDGHEDVHEDVHGALDPRAIADRVAELLREPARAGGRIVGIRTRTRAPGAHPRPAAADPSAAPPAATDPAMAARVPGVLARAAALLLAEHRFGGLYVTGGDIAEAVTRALDSDGFAIDTEILPLAVAGRLVGGDHDGLPFATKGGLIGDRTATVACLEHLAAVSARRERAQRTGESP
jgi:D-threonate/D-erythronate kinase